MPLRIGIDLVHIPRIRELLSNQTALKRIYSPQELMNRDPAHLAGLLAVKESIFKAMGIAPSWKDIEVRSLPNGKPCAIPSGKCKGVEIIDVSISHDGDYAVAMALIEEGRG